MLAGRPFTVLDISVEGSLGLVDVELHIGSQHSFRIGVEGNALDLTAQVVRVTAASGAHGLWRTAVTFGEFTSIPRHQVAEVIARLLREHRR